MLIAMLFDIAPVLEFPWGGILHGVSSALLFVSHLICPENEMLMNSDYLYEAFLLWQTALLLHLSSVFCFVLEEENQGQSTTMPTVIWFN